jgi:hypothetical protein
MIFIPLQLLGEMALPFFEPQLSSGAGIMTFEMGHQLSFISHELLKSDPLAVSDLSKGCYLMDLSLMPRAGLRGPDAAVGCQAQKIPVAAKPNSAMISKGDELVLRLVENSF